MPAVSRLWIALGALACVAYSWLVHVFMTNADTPELATALALLNGLPHAVANALLLWMFGRTLKSGREPLITGFARRVHGTLSPELESYTRGVTRAWCIFFGAEIAISAVLLAAAPLEAWSLFVNTLTLPLVVAMFVAEYALRIARFPGLAHASIWKGVQMFVERDRPGSGTPRNSP
jgi:uncharacterized membrane protein